MSFEERIEFTKENIDIYLKELAKEYRRKAGKDMPSELRIFTITARISISA